MFTPELLDVLPPEAADKIRRLEAAGTDADLLRRAARWLELHGATARHAAHGVRPAHVVPTLPGTINNHVAAVEEARQRLAELDAYAAALHGKVAAGELMDVWADVLATDAGLARLAWERIEEALICDAAARGIAVERRPDIDIAALMEIERA